MFSDCGCRKAKVQSSRGSSKMVKITTSAAAKKPPRLEFERPSAHARVFLKMSSDVHGAQEGCHITIYVVSFNDI
jgi:hypothetical protein